SASASTARIGCRSCASLLSLSSSSLFFIYCSGDLRALHSFPTRRSSDLGFFKRAVAAKHRRIQADVDWCFAGGLDGAGDLRIARSEEHTSELQSRFDLVCRLLLEKKKLVEHLLSECQMHMTDPGVRVKGG